MKPPNMILNEIENSYFTCKYALNNSLFGAKKNQTSGGGYFYPI